MAPSGEAVLLGLDLGTTECKAAAISPRGEVLGAGRVPFSLLHPAPGRVEQDARAWWAGASEAAAQALASASVAPTRVLGLGVSSQGISFVPVDDGGEPLANAISWLDTRAEAQARAILARFPADELFAISGKRASACYVLPKLLWLQQCRPDLFSRAQVFLMAHDFVVRHLTGLAVTDGTLASGTALYDVQQQAWSHLLLDSFALAEPMLPPLAWTGDLAGRLCPAAAAQIGLPEGIAVAVGGQDQKLAAMAAGVGSRRATVSLGTASAVSLLVGRPVLDHRMLIPLCAFCVPDTWALEGVVGTAGASLAWARETMAAGAPYDRLDAEARDSGLGAGGVRFYPHLAGATSPSWQQSALGAFTGLSLATRRGDLVRAVLEGVAYQVGANLEHLVRLAGDIDDLVVFGGGAKSGLWCQMLADVLGRPVGVTDSVELASVGAGMAAAVAAGLYGSLAEARAAMVQPTRWLQPEAAAEAAYREAWPAYFGAESALLAVEARTGSSVGGG